MQNNRHTWLYYAEPANEKKTHEKFSQLVSMRIQMGLSTFQNIRSGSNSSKTYHHVCLSDVEVLGLKCNILKQRSVPDQEHKQIHPQLARICLARVEDLL
jgi:hypothetical protein